MIAPYNARLGSVFLKLGHIPEQNHRIGLLARNSGYLKARSYSSLIWNRTFSTISKPSFRDSLTSGKEALLQYDKLTSLEKAQHLTCAAVCRHLKIGFIPLSQLELFWDELASTPSSEFSSLGKYNPKDPFANFVELFSRRHRPLLKETLLHEYTSANFIRTFTELVWATQKPTIPLTTTRPGSQRAISLPESLQRNSLIQSLLNVAEEDAVASWKLAIPFINDRTLIHEYGCWNGANLIGLLFFGHEQGIYPARCVGTDINYSSLNVAETTASIFSLNTPLIQFYLSNALSHQTNALSQKQLKIALRLLPVFEPSDAKDFLIQAKRTMTRESHLILSYALPQGNQYDKNNELAETSPNLVRKDRFDYGVIFRNPFELHTQCSELVEFPNKTEQVVNCYYTSEGFENLAHLCGYRILESVMVGKHSDNDRMVVALKAKD